MQDEIQSKGHSLFARSQTARQQVPLRDSIGLPLPPPFSAKNRINIDLALVPLRPEAFWAGGNPFVFSGGFRASILRIDYLDGGCRPDEGRG